MNRRNLLKTSLAAGLPLLTGCGIAHGRNPVPLPKIIRPKKLKEGSTVRLIAPGGPVNEAKVEKAIKNLETLGLNVQISKNILAKNGQNAGTDAQRLEDFHQAFRDKEVEAVWAIRGGDGSTKLLPSIDFDLIAKNPKILIGFSDITALLQANFVQTGLIGFHGPIGYWPLTEYNLKSLKAALFTGETGYTIAGNQQTETLYTGRATGRLIGGNLSLLASLCGTKNGFDATGKIIFIEDVGEAPRRIDRMLTQLRQAANLGSAAGIILGEFLDCDCERSTTDPDKCEGNSLTLREVLKDRLLDLGLPLVYNFPFGHDENLCTFPVGAMVELDATERKVNVLEAVVAG